MTSTGAERSASYIGQPMRRREDGRLVTGRGCYSGDVQLPGLTHMAVLRSPLAHARLRSLDPAAARSLPGVLAAWGAADLPEVAAFMPDRVPGVVAKPRQVLAAGEVRYGGEPIAVVVAESACAAADALEAIAVDLDPLPAVTDVRDAAARQAPLVHADVPGNVAGAIVRVKGDAEAAFGPGAVVERASFSMARIAAAAMEPRTGIAAWEDGGLTIWASTAAHFRVRDAVAGALALEPERVRVLVPDVGGSFGSKVAPYPEDVLAAAAARRLGRPVRYTLSRSDDLASTNQAHGVALDLELAADGAGRLRGLRGTIWFPLGAYAAGGVPERPLQHLLGAYRLPAVSLELRACFTNTAPTAAVRGGGRPVGNFGIERMIDRLARRLGADPLDLRRRNLVHPSEMPYDIGVDFGSSRIVYDGGDFPRLLDSAASALSYDELRRRQDAGERIGVGVPPSAASRVICTSWCVSRASAAAPRDASTPSPAALERFTCLMAKRRRKTLVVCRICHENIHLGRPTTSPRT